MVVSGSHDMAGTVPTSGTGRVSEGVEDQS